MIQLHHQEIIGQAIDECLVSESQISNDSLESKIVWITSGQKSLNTHVIIITTARCLMQALQDNIVRTSDRGNAIVDALADKSIVIANDNGILTTGKSIQSVLWDNIITHLATGIHIAGNKLGLQAETIPDEYRQKSKIRVCDKQCDDRWKSYLETIAC